LIDPDRLRIAHRVADPFEGRDNVFGPMAEPRIDDGREPAECVHDGEDADLLTTGQLVRDEVHGPDLVGCGSCATIVAQLRLPSSLRRPVAQLQAQFVVNPMGLLQIDLPSLAAQKDMNAPIAVADPRGANLLDPGFKTGLLAATGVPSAPCRRMNAFCPCENCDAFIVFRSSQPGNQARKNSSQKRSSLRGADHFRGRTHLVSPTMAVAAAIAGRFVDERDLG